jgi:hypothetical protein
VRIASRSGINLYQHCPRAYYYKYEEPEGGPGIEPTERPEYYALGISFHETGEMLLRGADGASAGLAGASDARERGLSERWQNWILGAALAWERTEAEEFFETYDIISIEEEVYVPIARDVALYGRADAVLRDRNTGALYVWNWKTAADIKDWNKRFFFDIQSWTEAIAVSTQVGEQVDGVIYGGVWKGPMYKGFSTSRLVGGYKGASTGGQTVYSATRSKGLTTKFNAWEEVFPFGEGLAAWVSWLPADLVRGHFAVSAPQTGDDTQIDQWVRGIARRESDIAHVTAEASPEEVREFFTQNIDERCERCPYLDLCANRASVSGLIEGGQMKKRDASHLSLPPALQGVSEEELRIAIDGASQEEL